MASQVQTSLHSMLNHFYEDLVIAVSNLQIGITEVAVHDARVAIRSIKSVFKTCGPLLQNTPTEHLICELNWLNKNLAEIRDLDVMSEIILDLGSKEFKEPIAQLLRGQRAHLEIAVSQVVQSERCAKLIRALFQYSKEIPVKSQIRKLNAAKQNLVLQNLLLRTWCDLFSALATTPKQPSPKALHAIRIATKQCRYASEAAKVAKLFDAENQISWAKALQQVLGQVQDEQTLRNWIKSQDGLTTEIKTSALLQIGQTRLSIKELLSVA